LNIYQNFIYSFCIDYVIPEFDDHELVPVELGFQQIKEEDEDEEDEEEGQNEKGI